jgi:hypothetical protein
MARPAGTCKTLTIFHDGTHGLSPGTDGSNPLPSSGESGANRFRSFPWSASLSTGYRSLDCQRIVYCRLPVAGGEGDKSDLMVFNKLATFNGFVIKAAHPLSRAIVSFHGVANAVTAMTGMALV